MTIGEYMSYDKWESSPRVIYADAYADGRRALRREMMPVAMICLFGAFMAGAIMNSATNCAIVDLSGLAAAYRWEVAVTGSGIVHFHVSGDSIRDMAIRADAIVSIRRPERPYDDVKVEYAAGGDLRVISVAGDYTVIVRQWTDALRESPAEARADGR